MCHNWQLAEPFRSGLGVLDGQLGDFFARVAFELQSDMKEWKKVHVQQVEKQSYFSV